MLRVKGKTLFNASRTRNLGAKAADAAWWGFFDADVLMAPDFASTVVPTLAPGHFYCADRRSAQAWGSIICHRDAFQAGPVTRR